MGDFTLSHRLELTCASESHRATPQRSTQPAEAVCYYDDNPPFRHGHYQGEREFHPPQRPEITPRAEMDHKQERIYRGPAPTIPILTSADPKQFSRLRMALENLLPADATERFKYQVLTDHLKVEEAMLIADSYCNSVRPYSDTMRALITMYGQPHKPVLQNIAEVLEGPNIRSGDIKAFKLFALRVRSLLSMLEQLGSEGAAELECGSH